MRFLLSVARKHQLIHVVKCVIFIAGLQPRDKASMLVDKTIKKSFAELSLVPSGGKPEWALWRQLQPSNGVSTSFCI